MQKDRATKKQQELLQFVDAFIKEHGYGPSYREVMRSLDYKSVSTVAVHVDGLIAKGYLRRKDKSARSLEVVGHGTPKPKSSVIAALEEKLTDDGLTDEDKAALKRVKELFDDEA